MSLIPDSLYIWLRYQGGAHKYHWGFYLHQSKHAGTKYHIRNLGQGWILEIEGTHNFMKEFLLIGCLRIAIVPSMNHNRIQKILQDIPYISEDGTMTCRIWVLNGLKALIDGGHVRCDDLQALEQEVFDFGLVYFEETEQNKQPRPIVDSKSCTL
ncbi:unnamed protein product [Somion occarium]|uniref:Uncharacterized protein n=1 Tax=Somion occarium TaxID=3059160 RepID=A0ABP1DKV1_9APHY